MYQCCALTLFPSATLIVLPKLSSKYPPPMLSTFTFSQEYLSRYDYNQNMLLDKTWPWISKDQTGRARMSSRDGYSPQGTELHSASTSASTHRCYLPYQWSNLTCAANYLGRQDFSRYPLFVQCWAPHPACQHSSGRAQQPQCWQPI